MMNVDLAWKLAGIGHVLLIVLIPTLLLFMPSASRVMSTARRRLVIAVVVTWIILNVYRLTIELPIRMALARTRGDKMYDGVGGNVAILFAGWVEPLIVGAVLLIAARLITGLRQDPNKRQQSKPGSPRA